MPNPLLAPLLLWARRLRFPRLLALTAALFALTLVVPDPLPFVDELLLALGTMLFASWKRHRGQPLDAMPPPRVDRPRRERP